MTQLQRRPDRIISLLRYGRIHKIRKYLSHQLHQEWFSYGLRRDLSLPFDPPKARIPLAIRELREDDIPHLLPETTDHLEHHERLEIATRRSLIDFDIPSAYVAVDLRKKVPCFVQWLMGPKHNERIQYFFKGRFPILQNDEVLLENAYTPLAYRSKGIMPAAMAMVAEKASEDGFRYALTFVLHDNVPSLKGCTKAGFKPYMMRHDVHTLFHLFKRRAFSRLPSEFSLPHEKKRTSQEASMELV